MKHFLLASVIAAGVITIAPFEASHAKTYRCKDSNGKLMFTQRRSDCAGMRGSSVTDGTSTERKRRSEVQRTKSKELNEQLQQQRFKDLYSNVEYRPSDKTLLSPER